MMMKIFVAVFWIVMLLGWTAQNVSFPTQEIKWIFVMIFVIGCAVLTVFVRWEEK